jgi:uncharacterized membrane protein YvbJ
MIICDKCGKEIKHRENQVRVLVNKEQKHYCKKCSPFPNKYVWWIVLGVIFLILLIFLLVLILVGFSD